MQDVAAGRLFVNLEDTGAIGVIDIATHTLAATWPLAGCEEPTGLGFDPKSHRLFSACANKVMTVTDSTNRQGRDHRADRRRCRRRGIRSGHRATRSPPTAPMAR